MNKEISDDMLMKLIGQNDQSAFEVLVKRHTSYAFTVAQRITNSAEDAEEIVQDCFMKVGSHPNKFSGESKFTTWFFRVVSNAALSRMRKKQIPRESIDERHVNIKQAENQFDILARQDQKRIIENAMMYLKPEERSLVTLYYLKEFDQDEIAEMTNLDKGSIKVKLFRARKKLSEAIKRIANDAKEILTTAN